MTPLTDLVGALRLGSSECVSVVGGGGKTTIMYSLARTLRGRRVVTTTTKMGHDQHGDLPVVLNPELDELVARSDHGPVVAWSAIDGQKALGVSTETCDEWFGVIDHVLIEADGSRRRPFKSPAPYEPVVPASTTVMVSVIGASALGQRIDAVSHRAELVAARAGCSVVDELTPERVAAVLAHPEGAERVRPTAARSIVLINAVRPETEAIARQTQEHAADWFDQVLLIPSEDRL